MATEFISETNAALFEDFFPGDVQKAAAAKFCRAIKKGFKVLNSNGIDSPLFGGENLTHQKEIIKDMVWYFQYLKNVGNFQFHEGTIMTLKGI